MRRLWDTLGAVLITAFIVFMLVQMIKPYAPYIIIAGFILLIGHRVLMRRREW